VWHGEIGRASRPTARHSDHRRHVARDM
jgi:hypothetical protein